MSPLINTDTDGPYGHCRCTSVFSVTVLCIKVFDRMVIIM